MTVRSRLLAVLPVVLLAFFAGAAPPAFAVPAAPPSVAVGAVSLQARIDAARPGDVVEVPAGVYPGAIVVDKPLTLRGRGRAVIDGGGVGTVVTLAAPQVEFSGFTVRGSGIEPDRNDAGIALLAPGITVTANHLDDVLVGILVSAADGAVLRGNRITGKPDLDQARKGDGIRVWYSRDVLVEANTVHQVRDIVLWYSERPVVRGNTISESRYGIHLMYSDGTRLEDNRLLDNSVGVYAMYSSDVRLIRNLVRGQRGPSGYGLAFKDSDRVRVQGNVLADDRVGIFLDGTPFSDPESAVFEDNILAYNDVGVLLQPAVRGNRFFGNTFWENTEQVALHGGGTSANSWRGNTWSDYSGFDADGDGRGDLPHRPQRLFEAILVNEPRLRMILHSPATSALDFAAGAFPLVLPQALLSDPEPRLVPAELPDFARSSGSAPSGMPVVGAILAGVGAIGVALGRSSRTVQARASIPLPRPTAGRPAIEVRHVSKTYGRLTALDQVSLEVPSGQALALWGPNGAGKTTLLNAILGLIKFDGDIRLMGLDVRAEGKDARSRIGFVPQSMAFYEAGVLETMTFYARIRGDDPARQIARLESLGLGSHLGAPVASLSGGMRQRLALAVALIGDPPVLLMDEPTANLDLTARDDHRRLLADLRHEGRTLVFATHRVDEIQAVADQVAVLDRGRLAQVLDRGGFLRRFGAKISMTVHVSSAQAPEAFRLLDAAGLSPQLSGRGAIVVRLPSDEKMKALNVLLAGGLKVRDFSLEEAGAE